MWKPHVILKSIPPASPSPCCCGYSFFGSMVGVSVDSSVRASEGAVKGLCPILSGPVRGPVLCPILSGPV